MPEQQSGKVGGRRVLVEAVKEAERADAEEMAQQAARVGAPPQPLSQRRRICGRIRLHHAAENGMGAEGGESLAGHVGREAQDAAVPHHRPFRVTAGQADCAAHADLR